MLLLYEYTWVAYECAITQRPTPAVYFYRDDQHLPADLRSVETPNKASRDGHFVCSRSFQFFTLFFETVYPYLLVR